MPGCLVALVVVGLLLPVLPYILGAAAVAAGATALVYGVHWSGSLTALLVVPRTPERWLRLIARCPTQEKLDVVVDRYRLWLNAVPRTPIHGAGGGFLAGAAWSVLGVALICGGLNAVGLRSPSLTACAVLIMLYAGLAARAAGVNTLMRLAPDEFGLAAVDEELSRRVWRPPKQKPSSGPSVAVPAAVDVHPPATPAVTSRTALTPQPRAVPGSLRATVTAPTGHPAGGQRAAAPALDEQQVPVFGALRREAATATLSSSAARPAPVTCGACGRAISALASCACS